MYLKSLTLKGFKSFADRTHMVFDPGLTVVVGPNGSGKSNISDAILWVLGEQSAKMLRGQAMEDVIFAGSSARKPVGLAEVTLTLDNSDHTLPIEFSEVAITRRMFRSGESEYLVNGAPARLMDIQDILHDSGLGKDTHSIISQGKLDAVLQSRPEDRRDLIEEAAGISKHRRRKERSERKLKDMDKNLVRAKDVAKEINRQLRPLERQVEKAKKFKVLDEQARELKIRMAVDELRDLQQSYEDVQNNLRETQAQEQVFKLEFEQKSEQLEKLQKTLEEKGLFVGDLDEKRQNIQDLLANLTSNKRLLEEKRYNMQKRAEELEQRSASFVYQKKELREQIDAYQKDATDLQAKTSELEKQLSSLEPEVEAQQTKRQELDDMQAQLTHELHTARQDLQTIEADYERLHTKLSEADVKDELIAQQIERVRDTQKTYGLQKEQLQARLEKTKATLDEKQQEKETVASELAQKKEQLKNLRAQEDELRQKLSATKASLAGLQSVDEIEALANPLIRSVVQDQKCANHIQARLADVISAPSELETCIEWLLGDDLEAFIVADDKAALALAEHAQTTQENGYVTVLRTNVGETKRLDISSARPLFDLLEVDATYAHTVALLLQNIYVVRDLKTALAAHDAHTQASFITPDADCVLSDGRIYIGQSQDKEQGVLERKRRMRSLEAEVAKIQDSYDKAQKELEQLNEHIAQDEEKYTRLTQLTSELSGSLASFTADIERLNTNTEQTSVQLSELEEKRETQKEEFAQARPLLEEKTRQRDEKKKYIAQTEQRAQELSDTYTKVREVEVEMVGRLGDLKLSYASAKERSAHVTEKLDEAKRRLASLEHKQTHMQVDVREAQARLLRLPNLDEAFELLYEKISAWQARLADKAQLAQADSQSLKDTIQNARQAANDAQAQFEEARKNASELSVVQAQLQVKVENAVCAITECDVVLEDALAQEPLEDREKASEKLASLTRQIDALGPVNQVAFEEYETLKKRSDYIAEQVQDLEAARQALTKITAAIDRKMRKAFLLTFDKVNTNFQEIFSMLFPGGKAHLEMDDPDHPAKTGIEVIAQPKGKRIAKMSLMSGGERSLVALALLFAVYRTRTVPFYVFDEVEAALDDSNLDKLLGAIEMLKETTQLIVISHQRRTMEQADVLYGVSMHADGVTHVVSQRLDITTGKVVDA